MKNKKFTLYWILALAGIILISAYPLYMGIRVISDMIRDGYVLKTNYPKYIIPYTPISFAVILGVLLLPLFIKLFKKFAVLGGSALSVAAFFGSELLFERMVVVSEFDFKMYPERKVMLQDWQMYMCASYSDAVKTYRPLTPVEILMGEYSPAFKLHFYLISVVLILAVLNCVYGFAQMIKTGDSRRKKALILQSISAAIFLGLCLLACFTAFFRDGNINVSPISAVLMILFFILLGVTVGIFAGSLLLNKKRPAALWVPTVLSTATTLVMYIGEMILLNWHLYRFGSGFFFAGLPGIILAPVDLLVILASGLITFLLMRLLIGRPSPEEAAK